MSEKPADIQPADLETIELSTYTHDLIRHYHRLWHHTRKYTGDYIDVSDAVTLLAQVYEKMRNSLEFSEHHLIRRSAIIRILRRRLAKNQTGKGEGITILKELLWGRYIAKSIMTKDDADVIELILNKIMITKILIIKKYKIKKRGKIDNFFYDLAACEIDEFVNNDLVEKLMSQLYYIYQTTHQKIEIVGLEEQLRDQYYFAAVNSAYLKNDAVYICYHLLTLQLSKFRDLDDRGQQYLIDNYQQIFKKIDAIINNPYQIKLTKFVAKLLPPYLILFAMFEEKKDTTSEYFINKLKLTELNTELCNQKYRKTSKKLRSLGLRSIIYIFITKMFFVIILEVPISILILKQFHILPLIINTVIPPIMMILIVGITMPPSNFNTTLILNRLIDIVNADESYEKKAVLTINPKKSKKSSLGHIIFSVIYLAIFLLVFGSIFTVLRLLNFNIISILIFFFFISVVTFFGYRIRIISRQYSLETKSGFLSHIFDLIFLPILSLGKILSSQLSKLNVFIIIFDFLLEAPFKAFIEVLEAWMSYARRRKEEIA